MGDGGGPVSRPGGAQEEELGEELRRLWWSSAVGDWGSAAGEELRQRWWSLDAGEWGAAVGEDLGNKLRRRGLYRGRRRSSGSTAAAELGGDGGGAWAVREVRRERMEKGEAGWRLNPSSASRSVASS